MDSLPSPLERTSSPTSSPPKKAPSPPKKARISHEYEDFSSIPCPEGNQSYKANVHGVVTSLSPIKPNTPKPYFAGYISDGKKKMRFVGFSHSKEKKLLEFEKKPILFSNCVLKKSLSGEKMELIVRDSTSMTNSPKQIEVDQDANAEKCIVLEDLSELAAFTRASAKVKVLGIDAVLSLDDGRRIQNITIGDATSTATLSLWENHVNSMLLDRSYFLANVMVKCYGENKTLFTPKEEVFIKMIEDLDDVMPVIPPTNSTSNTISNVQVIAVSDLKLSHSICLNCKNGQILAVTGNQKIGCCIECNTTVLMKHCKKHTSAVLTLSWEGNFQRQLTASGPILEDIAEDDISEMQLLLCRPFTVSYVGRNITGIRR